MPHISYLSTGIINPYHTPICPDCQGTGYEQAEHVRLPCSTCNGSGHIIVKQGGMFLPILVLVVLVLLYFAAIYAAVMHPMPFISQVIYHQRTS